MKAKLSILTGLLVSLSTLPAIAASYPTANWTHVPAREMATHVTRADGSKASYTLDAERLDGGWYEAMPRDIAIDADPAAGTMEAYLNEDDSMVFELRNGLFSNVVSRQLSVISIPGYNCQQKLRASYLFAFQRDNRNVMQMGFTEQLIDTASTNNCQKYLSDGIRNPSILKIFTSDNSPARNLLDSGLVSESDFVNTRMIHMYNNFQGQLYSANTGLLARCDTEAGMLTRQLFGGNQIDHIQPVGAKGSRESTLPGPAMVFRMDQSRNASRGVYSPGKIRVFSVDRIYTATRVYHTVRFRGCREMKTEFHSMFSVSLELQAKMNESARAGKYACKNTLENGRTIGSICSFKVSLDLSPGQLIGTLRSGDDLVTYTTDKRATSSFIHPEYYSSQYTKASCFLDYFAAAPKQLLLSKLGYRTSAGFVNTGCGRVDLDIKDKATGNWFRQGNLQVASDNLHFAPHPYLSNRLLAGIGEGLNASIKGRMHFESRPVNAGRINLDFARVNLGQIYCYENPVAEDGNANLGTMVLLLKPIALNKMLVAIDNTKSTCPAAGVTTMPAETIIYQR